MQFLRCKFYREKNCLLKSQQDQWNYNKNDLFSRKLTPASHCNVTDSREPRNPSFICKKKIQLNYL